ncbi:hypothetical protein [Arthrobacter sp. zg-Y877]|uniref:hypothetical protein n=1 Tax=Arthrobacter sp. zg-Y877 TaxID=3049074 RepID=UPI0025A4282E|nr:hypothetical protein [Arthrobacter sp. zg-Y877]MDM7989029.1 hypothetical protein [Arthrobacter sp. zg-Y877]
MDQLGNTEPITEEPGSEDHPPDVPAGQAEVSCTLSAFRADLGAGEADVDAAEPAAAGPADAATAEPAADADPSRDPAYPDGFTGVLALQNLEAFDEDMAGEALGRMAHLISGRRRSRPV